MKGWVGFAFSVSLRFIFFKTTMFQAVFSDPFCNSANTDMNLRKFWEIIAFFFYLRGFVYTFLNLYFALSLAAASVLL